MCATNRTGPTSSFIPSWREEGFPGIVFWPSSQVPLVLSRSVMATWPLSILRKQCRRLTSATDIRKLQSGPRPIRISCRTMTRRMFEFPSVNSSTTFIGSNLHPSSGCARSIEHGSRISLPDPVGSRKWRYHNYKQNPKDFLALQTVCCLNFTEAFGLTTVIRTLDRISIRRVSDRISITTSTLAG